MAPPPPRPAPATAAPAGRSGPQPPPGERQPDFSKEIFLFQMAVSGFCFVSVLAIFLLICFGPPANPTLKVASLTVSNLTVAAVAASTGATWKAALLAERSWIWGRLFFTEVECFLYYQWDVAQRLAAAPAKPFMLRSTDRTMVKARMTMGRPEEVAVAKDMDLERRSVGTVVVGLGLRMRGTYVLASWYKKDIGHIEAHCDNLRIVFVNSTTEGSLVAGADIATEDHPLADNLPLCSY